MKICTTCLATCPPNKKKKLGPNIPIQTHTLKRTADRQSEPHTHPHIHTYVLNKHVFDRNVFPMRNAHTLSAHRRRGRASSHSCTAINTPPPPPPSPPLEKLRQQQHCRHRARRRRACMHAHILGTLCTLLMAGRCQKYCKRHIMLNEITKYCYTLMENCCWSALCWLVWCGKQSHWQYYTANE